MPSVLGQPARLQFISNRNVVCNSTRQGTAGSRTDVLTQTRSLYTVGNKAVSQLRALQTGFIMTATGDTSLGNDITWECALELPTPSCYQELYTEGTNLPTIKNGAPFLITDQASGFDVPANGIFFVREAKSIANDTLLLPAGTWGTLGSPNDQGFLSPAATSQIPAAGSMSNPSGGTGFSPSSAIILGVPTAPMASILYIGDSIADGTGDAQSNGSNNGYINGNIGFIARGLGNVNNSQVPYCKVTIGSWTFAYCLASNAPLQRTLWPYATSVVIALGTNDIAANGSNLAAMQTFVTNLCTSIKNVMGPYEVPVKTAVCTLMPRTTSTDSWATAANQTPVSGMGVGQTRDTYNAWLKAQPFVKGSPIDAVIDVNPFVEDSANPGKWITNGVASYPTADGVHPSPLFHGFAGTAVNNWAYLNTFA